MDFNIASVASDLSSLLIVLIFDILNCCYMTGSDVSHMTEVTSVIVRKYVLRMRNRKLRHIYPSGVFWPEVT
jgi:hypothetical protein